MMIAVATNSRKYLLIKAQMILGQRSKSNNQTKIYNWSQMMK